MQQRLPAPTDDFFCPVDLADWLRLAEHAGVPFIPAEFVADADRFHVAIFDDPTPEAIKDLKAFFAAVREAQQRPGDWTMRWACCVCEAMKGAVAYGRVPTREERMSIQIDDMRAYELVSDFPRKRVPAYIRPYVEIDRIDTYPVEYRVFVIDDAVAGISNYYPQRELPETMSVMQDVATIRGYAERLIAAQSSPMLCPQAEGAVDLARNTWSADFVRTVAGDILLIEGGPPTIRNWGSHECCFAGGGIDGLALAPIHQKPAISLPEAAGSSLPANVRP